MKENRDLHISGFYDEDDIPLCHTCLYSDNCDKECLEGCEHYEVYETDSEQDTYWMEMSYHKYCSRSVHDRLRNGE